MRHQVLTATLVYALTLASGHTQPIAQRGTAKPAATDAALASTSVQSPASAVPAPPPAGATSNIPGTAAPLPAQITVELKGQQPSSGSSTALLAVVVPLASAFLAGLVAFGTTLLTARTQVQLEASRIEGRRESLLLADGLKAPDRAQRALEHDDRVGHQMRELQLKANVSDVDAFMAATRLVHEREVAEATLVHTFFDRLLSDKAAERTLALFAISAVVDPQTIAHLASGGEALVPREGLSLLAAAGRKDVAAAAQNVLNKEALGIQPSVIRVFRTADSTESASGFLAASKLIVSSGDLGLGANVYVQLQPGQPRIVAECVSTDTANRVFAARLSAPLAAEPLPLSKEGLEPEQRVKVVQWNGEGQFVTRVGTVRATNRSALSGTVKNAIELSIPAEHGGTGAPVLDDQGRVVGIVVCASSLPHALAISATALENVVKQAPEAPLGTNSEISAAGTPAEAQT